MASKKEKKSKRAAAPKVHKPRQATLAGMEDAKLEELHGLAEDYVKVRDRRIALNAEEKPLKDELLAVMKKNNKQHYKHNGLEISVVHESEKVKVKLHRDTEESEAAPF